MSKFQVGDLVNHNNYLTIKILEIDDSVGYYVEIVSGNIIYRARERHLFHRYIVDTYGVLIKKSSNHPLTKIFK